MRIEQDYCKVLGVAPNASTEDIKSAYYKLAFIHHPDKNLNNPEANVKMVEINKAYAAYSTYLQRSKCQNPIGYSTPLPKFKIGSRVRIMSRSSPHMNYVGIVDKQPFKDTFRFWYMVKLESKNVDTVVRFAEEQLSEVGE
jgi:preprotein translocase subunit Sec63